MKINYPLNTKITFGDLSIGALFLDADTLYAKSHDVYNADGRFIGNALIIGETPIGCLYTYENFMATEEVIPISEITLQV